MTIFDIEFIKCPVTPKEKKFTKHQAKYKIIECKIYLIILAVRPLQTYNYKPSQNKTDWFF